MISSAPIDVTRNGMMFPSVGCIVSIPEAFLDTVRGRRLHLKVARLAAAETLKWHNKAVMPDHFIQTNRAKYEHKERQPRYKAYKKKRWRSITDLKASRKSESEFKAPPRVQFARSADDTIHAFMRYKWPFPGNRGNQDKTKVTIFDMNSEVTRWTPEEIEQAAKIYRGHFARIYMQELKALPKFKRIILPKLQSL